MCSSLFFIVKFPHLLKIKILYTLGKVAPSPKYPDIPENFLLQYFPSYNSIMYGAFYVVNRSFNVKKIDLRNRFSPLLPL